MIIHATRKLAARLPDVSPDALQEDSPLGSWHADRLVIDRRQCVLFRHDESRCALFVPLLSAAINGGLPSHVDKMPKHRHMRPDMSIASTSHPHAGQ